MHTLRSARPSSRAPCARSTVLARTTWLNRLRKQHQLAVTCRAPIASDPARGAKPAQLIDDSANGALIDRRRGLPKRVGSIRARRVLHRAGRSKGPLASQPAMVTAPADDLAPPVGQSRGGSDRHPRRKLGQATTRTPLTRCRVNRTQLSARGSTDTERGFVVRIVIGLHAYSFAKLREAGNSVAEHTRSCLCQQ